MPKQSEFLVPYALVERMFDTLQDVLDRQQEMIGQIHHHQVQANAPTAPLTPMSYDSAKYMSEEEEDLRFQAENGLIDAGELEEALARMDFLSTDIDIVS